MSESIQQSNTYLAVVLPLVGTAIIAIGGWLFTYIHKRQNDARAARLERINQQLRLFYGPLYAQLKGADAAWTKFCSSYWPSHGRDQYFPVDVDPTEEEKERWRLWMKEVFEPLNSKTEALILEHMDLIDGEDMDESFIEAIAHVSAYRVIIKQWETGDFSEHTSICDYPSEGLFLSVEPIYKQLRKEQQQLIEGMQIETKI